MSSLQLLHVIGWFPVAQLSRKNSVLSVTLYATSAWYAMIRYLKNPMPLALMRCFHHPLACFAFLSRAAHTHHRPACASWPIFHSPRRNKRSALVSFFSFYLFPFCVMPPGDASTQLCRKVGLTRLLNWKFNRAAESVRRRVRKFCGVPHRGHVSSNRTASRSFASSLRYRQVRSCNCHAWRHS